jgi:hypothetical protein
LAGNFALQTMVEAAKLLTKTSEQLLDEKEV